MPRYLKLLTASSCCPQKMSPAASAWCIAACCVRWPLSRHQFSLAGIDCQAPLLAEPLQQLKLPLMLPATSRHLHAAEVARAAADQLWRAELLAALCCRHYLCFKSLVPMSKRIGLRDQPCFRSRRAWEQGDCPVEVPTYIGTSAYSA